MKISQRAQNMPQSPIRKLAKYAEAAHRNGIHIYSLNIGQPDIQTPDCAKDALTHFHKDILDYTPSQGVLSLRAKMVGYYAEYFLFGLLGCGAFLMPVLMIYLSVDRLRREQRWP